MQLVNRTSVRSFAIAAGIAIGIAGSAGIANAAPAEEPIPGGNSSLESSSTTVFQTPVFLRYVDDLAPTTAFVHPAAGPSDKEGTTTLTVSDPIASLFATAPQIHVNWRNLSTGASGVATLESDKARTEPVDVETGSGRIVATVTADNDNTIVPGFGTFSVD
ncbi:hypothetical protein [Rhodococcus sp. NPDC058521]|uniref:hypothetical protein n=1 Tax=Rhodococcus sp. NPDC058521 TaxID=3346536 RepID=UPI0036525B8C